MMQFLFDGISPRRGPVPVSLLLLFLSLYSVASGQKAPEQAPVSLNPVVFAKTGCNSTFLKRLGLPGQSAAGYKIVPATGGNFFLAAAAGDETMIVLANSAMEVLWAKSVDMAPGADVINDLRLDGEGQLIGVGNASSAPVECYAFKMNAADGQLIWRSQLNEPLNSYFTKIMEKSDGSGNYLLFGQTDAVSGGSGCDALLMDINRNTGALISDKHYTLGSCEIFNDVIIESGKIYVCGRYNLLGGGQSGFRAALSLLDTDGTVQWSRHYLRDNNQTARLYASSFVRDGDDLVLFGYGSDNSTSLTATTLQLMKTFGSAGSLAWAKKYDITDGNEERALKVLNLPDGYLQCGFYTRPSGREAFLIKTDKTGNYLWGKSYGGQGDDFIRDIILRSDTLYLVGIAANSASGPTDILVGKLDINGNATSDCPYIKDLVSVSVLDYLNTPDLTHSLSQLSVTHNYSMASIPANTERTLDTAAICQKICDDLCTLPDATAHIDAIACNSGSIELNMRICNTGSATMPANTAISLYDTDPTTTAANRLATLYTQIAADSGDCLEFIWVDLQIAYPAGNSFTLYVVANDNGSLAPPFALDSLAGSGILECDYSNNMDSRFFAPPPVPALELGPDVALCIGEEVSLDAGPGYTTYLWQDGSSDPQLTAIFTGIYRVEVGDACGFKQQDSVSVTVSLPTELTETVGLCPGDSVLIGGVYYNQPLTVIDTLAGTGDACDTMVTYLIKGPAVSQVQLQCPADITVQTAPGETTAMVNYDLPLASTDCNCSDASADLLQGAPSGSDFSAGVTQVCYAATDVCGGLGSCCFSVTVQATAPEDACDIKNIACVKFEILGIYQNPDLQRTYRMRVTNSCTNKLIYTTFQLPDGIIADAPTNNATYTSPAGQQYTVRNPNASPQHSIRFKTIGDGIANGVSDIFEYTLPPQADPLFIHATVRLDPQIYYEVHLNVFDCTVQQVPFRPAEARAPAPGIAETACFLFPNPVADVLQVYVPDWVDQQAQFRLHDAYGRLLQVQTTDSMPDVLSMPLAPEWPAGIYYLEATDDRGQRLIRRFVRVRG